MIKCEQCGKEINKKDAIRILIGNTWYFCGWNCVYEYSAEMLNIMEDVLI